MLCARYTLNNTIQNSGEISTTDNWTIQPTYKSGGIYQYAMTEGEMSWDAVTTAKILNNKAFTWAGWIYVDPNVSAQASPIFGNTSFGASNNRKFFFMQSPTQNDLSWSWMNDTGAITFTQGSLSDVFPSYEWTHLAITFGNGEMKVYINGQIEFTQVGLVSNSSTFGYETKIFHSNPARRLQDVRIYNETLDEESIKELSYGLEVHKKLNEPTSINLLINTKSSFTVNTSDCYVHLGSFYNGLEIGKKYVFEVTCDSPNNVLSTHGDRTGSTSKRLWTAWLYQKNSAYTSLDYASYDVPQCFDVNNFGQTHVGNTHFWIFEAKYPNVSIRMNGYKGSEDYDLNFPSIKLYKLDNITSTSLVVSTDTPRYSKSSKINGSLMLSDVVDKSNSMCISFWTKFNDLLQTMDFFKCANANAYTEVETITYTPDGSIESDVTSNVSSTDGITYKMGFEISDDATKEYTYTPFSRQGFIFNFNKGKLNLSVDDGTFNVGDILDTNWHHFIINVTGERNVNVYVDTELKVSGIPYSDFTINRASSTSETYFFGNIQISDFRVYGKTLLEDDLKELYGIISTDYKATN